MQVRDRSHSGEAKEAGERPEHQRAGAERARAPSEDVGAEAHRAVQQPGELLVIPSPPWFHLHPLAAATSVKWLRRQRLTFEKSTEGGGRLPVMFWKLKK